MVKRQTRIPDEEHALLVGILEYAQLKHVLANHQRPARTEQGWRTAIEGDEGFFDITMIGPGGILLVELKRRKGAKHSDMQLKWLEMAMRAKQAIGSPRVIVDTWTFDQWPDPGKTLIDTIAKAPAPANGLLREPPPRPSSPPGPPPTPIVVVQSAPGLSSFRRSAAQVRDFARGGIVSDGPYLA